MKGWTNRQSGKYTVRPSLKVKYNSYMEKSVGQKPSVSCPRCILLSVTPLKLSARGVYRVCVLMWDNRAVTFSHTSNGSHLVDIHALQPWELATSLHWGQKHVFLFVCSHRIGGALIKAFATTRSNPSGFYMSVQKTSKLALAHCFVFQCEATHHIKWLTKPGWKENILFMAVNEREEWDVRDGRNLP